MRIKDEDRRNRYLRQYPVTEYFQEKNRKAAEQAVEFHRFSKGDYVCEQSKKPEYLYFLLEGRMKLSMLHQNGNLTLVQYFEPVSVLGELELLGMRSQSQAITAVEDSLCAAFPFEGCRELLMNDTAFLQQLSRFLAGKMLCSVEKLVSTQSYPLENRLAAYLLDAAGEEWIHVSLTDLSQYFGVSYRHLSRVAGQFAASGWIEKQRRRLRILDEAALTLLAEEMAAE